MTSDLMLDLGEKAKKASFKLAESTSEQRNTALRKVAQALRTEQVSILAENQKDLDRAKENNLSGSLLGRLRLDEAALEGMAQSLEVIADLPDPLHKSLAKWDRPNGLKIERVSVPLGVIGLIYESRPNVTIDAGSLCLKSGNAAILRGGSDSFSTSSYFVKLIQKALKESDLPEASIQAIPSPKRTYVGDLLTMTEFVDVIVPRGGEQLIKRVQEESKIPVFAHQNGINHCYLDKDADPIKAKELVLNSKMRRPVVCGAAETVLVHEAFLPHLLPLLEELHAKGCLLKGDERIQALAPQLIEEVKEKDWSTEYLDAILSFKTVASLEEALAHIDTYSSQHTDMIATENMQTAQTFLEKVDSAIVMHNASTQFADGGEFGFGAEIGIATGKIHARGPVGLEQLTSYKYLVHGTGQTRP